MKNFFKKAAATVGMVLMSASTAFAQGLDSSYLGSFQVGRNDGDPIAFAINLINWAIGLVALVAVGVLIYSGVKYVTSNGDEKKVEEANKGIVNAIIGLVICFVAVMVVNFVIAQLGNTGA
jgi:heme/copper-type cytochrome/quinol oxidase subunit 2